MLTRINPKVIFIDWNGTLCNSKYWGHLEDDRHPDHYIFEKIESSLFGSQKHLLEPWMRGNYLTEEIIEIIADYTGLTKIKLMTHFVTGCKEMKIVSSKVTELIKSLRKNGQKIIIATDNTDSFNRWVAPALRLQKTFDAILNSYDLRALKNDFNEKGESLFFGQHLKNNNLAPSECVLIDNSEDKGNLIQNYGIHYLRIRGASELEYALADLVMQHQKHIQ